MILLSSCLPIPHRTQVIPEIFAKITNNGIPLSGVKVIIYRDRYDKDKGRPKLVIVTDSNGEIKFKGDKDFHAFMMLGDPISTWSMDIVYKNIVYLGWKDFGIGYAEQSQKFICELSYKQPEKSMNQGICK